MSAQKTAARGLVVFAHGSRVPEANAAVEVVARQLSQAGGFCYVEPAFLELGEPDLAGAVAKLLAQGIRDIIVLPYFLTLGTHLRRDLPRIADEIRGMHPGVKIEITEPLDGHPALVQALVDRASEALNGSGHSAGEIS